VLGTAAAAAAAAAGGHSPRGGDASWVAGVVVRLKELLLESDRWVGHMVVVVMALGMDRCCSSSDVHNERVL
jgi:hypothetical protein